MRKALLVGMILGIMAGVSVDVSGDTWQNEYPTNNTGEDANDLEKWLVGDVRVSGWLSWHFPTFDYIYDDPNDLTKLRWSGATIPPGQKTSACFRTDVKTVVHRYLPRWTYNEDPIAMAGAALSHVFDQQGEYVYLDIGNTAIDGGPLTIETIQVAAVSTPYSMEDLSWNGLEGVDWDETQTDVPIGLDEWIDFPGLILPPGGAIVYRVDAVWLDQDPENVVEYAGQYVPEPASFTLLGLGGLALLRLYRAR